MDKITKNNVSYFQAGFQAGLVYSGMDAEEVKHLFYSTIKYPNIMREFLRKYDEIEFDNEAVNEMSKYVEEIYVKEIIESQHA